MNFLFILLIILNLFFILRLKNISKLINLFDQPDNNLKIHKSKTPLLGGTFFIINLIFFITYKFLFDETINYQKFITREYFSIFFFITSFFVLGLIDDKYKLRPEKKIVFSILFSLISLNLNNNLIITNLQFSFYENTLYLNDFSYFFTIFCIVILINAINFYDGINGQSIIFFIFCFSYLAIKSQHQIIYLFIIIVLFFILYPNLLGKIFMGDSGIYLLGSILTISLIYEYNKFEKFTYADEIFLILIIPGYDLLRLSVTRIINGKNALYGDRNHIQHLLINKFSVIKSNIILFFLICMPICLFNFLSINFFLVLTLITIIYIVLVINLNDKKKYNNRGKK